MLAELASIDTIKAQLSGVLNENTFLTGFLWKTEDGLN